MRREVTVATLMELESNATQRRASLTITLLLVAGLMIAGCASRRLLGSPIEEDNLPKIAIGRTTRGDIFRLFGTPYRTEAKGDQEVLTYFYGKGTSWSALVYTETREKADILTVYIDPNGVVSNYAFSKGMATPENFLHTRPVVSPLY